MSRYNRTATIYVGDCDTCGRPFSVQVDEAYCTHAPRVEVYPRRLPMDWPGVRLSLRAKHVPVTEHTDGAILLDGEWVLPAETLDVTPFAALSDAGRAWLRAARRPTAYSKRCAVPQNLEPMRRAVRDYTDWHGLLPAREKVSQFDKHTWFAFDDLGKIVLSLKCDRDRALELAIAYNKAGGRLVLLAFGKVLAEVPDDQCIAIPDELPEAAPEPARDYLSAFAGDDGLRYTTPHGLVGIGRCRHEADRSVALVDPTKAGPAARETTKPHYEDPQDYAVAGWLEALHSANVLVAGYDGPSRKLPTPVTLLGKARKARRKMDALRWTADGRTFFYDLDRVKMLTKGTKTVRLDVLGTDAMRDCPLRVTRDDGLVGYTGQLDVSSYEVIG